MTFLPLNARVVIEQAKAAEKQGSIIVPEMAKEQPTEGTVVALASDCMPELSVGSKVLYSKYAGQHIQLEGKDYIVLKQVDVIGVFKT